VNEQIASWSAQQLSEFLAALSHCEEEADAIRTAVERAAESFEAEVGALVRGGEVVTAVGFPQGRVPVDALLAVAEGRASAVEIPGHGAAVTISAQLGDESDGVLLLARAGDDGFLPEEATVVRGMARVLCLTLRTLRVLVGERALLESLQQRRRLLEKTSSIHRLILRRRPLHEVLVAITEAAGDLLGDEIAGLRMITPDDPERWETVAATGVSPELFEEVRHGRVGDGAGGRASAEDRVVVIGHYETDEAALPAFADRRLQAAIAAPVHEGERVVGSLTVASFRPGRLYDDADEQLLLAFAEQVSLALLDAKNVEEMAHQALHDALTGLPNRLLFLDRLQHALERAARHGESAAVLFVDLDRFKGVNDSLGHAAGDELLVAVADRLRACVRLEDTAARLGGDEFAVLAEALDDRRDAALLAERILGALQQPFELHGREVFVTASIGIAVGESPEEELLRNADVAMYRAKAAGASYEFFEAGMRAAIVERLGLEADLRRAIERDELCLHYQPIVDLRTGQVDGVEALVRWQHPERGLLPPATFVALAEETGAIVEIGRWVLATACSQAAAWAAAPVGRRVHVAINVSVRQLQDADFVDYVAAAMATAGVDPSLVTLEITESVLVEQGAESIGKLAELKALGVRLALDDFGVGYSSLRYLSELPLDVLKVPKAFVDGIEEKTPEAALVRAIVELGGTLDLQVVAEGIETTGQAAALDRAGCQLGQGFLFARPAEAAAVDVLLDGRLVPIAIAALRGAA
jgi:diguanylate cyclase (GGDEF)-like protein